ncbi:major royal jelly protein 1-like [Hylaeus anthracinus]|uniref:major royal jelly protein 1-like n=1 Tax=Hylaeus anthracinus TaxID=313031 RepID=UPI0023B9E80E|nr:major royal jelly protein 1-like [Hylaeus anthracinus]XP_054013472.1 major royal jelly protein 1-like [Hylaeus anthracinus]
MWWSWWMALFFGAVSLERQVETLQVKSHKLQTKLEMKYVDFEFDSDKERKEAIDSGRYDHTKCIPIDVDRWGKDRMFVTVVRDKGVPASLTTVSNKMGPGGPLLKPYPNWSWYNHNNCNKPHIIGVYRVAIDQCNKLWVLDTGMTGSEATCPPQLLSFDLITNELLSAVTVPKEFAVNSTTGKGLLVTPIVRTGGFRCWETQVFIADPDGYALLVYDTSSTKWSRVISSALVYDPKAVTYTIAGESFDLMDGPVGMALSPTGETLYLSPMSSYKMVSASTDQLTRAKGVDDSVPFEVHEKLDSQLSAKAMSRKGTLFFGITRNASIGCWNERKALTEDNMLIIAQDPEDLQFVSGAKVVKGRYQVSEELLVLSNRYQKFVTGTMNFDEINFRILKGNVRHMIKGSVCDQ